MINNQIGKEVCILVNKNDLRFIKTEKIIEETYISLKKKTRSQIKVKELCEAALINKTTFYAHYETMEALHEHICKKTIENLLDSCPHIDKVFTDAADFVNSIMKTIQENSEILDTLFGADVTKQINAFEAGLLGYYLTGNESEEMKMKILFTIGGASRLLLGDQSAERINITIKLIRQVLGGKENKETSFLA